MRVDLYVHIDICMGVHMDMCTDMHIDMRIKIFVQTCV